MARSFRKDLQAARTAWIEEAATDNERERRNESDFLLYRDKDGRVADFHATRHTYISGIVATGASVKTAQELARHSTPVLTIGRYSHARLHDLQGALESLPDLAPSVPSPQVQRATGTDSMVGSVGANAGAVETKWEQMRGQLRGQSGDILANRGERKNTGEAQEPHNGIDSQAVTLSVVGNKKATAGEPWRERRARESNPQPAKPASDFESAARFSQVATGTRVTYGCDVPWCRQRCRENRTRRTSRKPFTCRDFHLGIDVRVRSDRPIVQSFACRTAVAP